MEALDNLEEIASGQLIKVEEDTPGEQRERHLSHVFQELLSVYLFVFGNIEFVLTMQVFAARWKLLGPLDCSLPSLADLLLTSAESWLVGAC